MITQYVEAIYEGGVLRPLEPISLVESQRVRLSVSGIEDDWQTDELEFMEKARAAVAKMQHRPSLEEVQLAMSKIPGSLVDDFIAERGER